VAEGSTDAVRGRATEGHDVVEDRTREGRKFRMPCVVDGFTREALHIRVARKLSSSDVIDVLSDLFIARGVPVFTRSDNGGEFTATAVQDWISKIGAKTACVAPGSPWENGCIESFNGKLRDELLDGEAFNTLAEVRVLIERWRRHHNTVRPHSALNYRPPAPEVVLPGGPAAANGSGSMGSPQPRVPTVH
jgi:putative transposase